MRGLLVMVICLVVVSCGGSSGGAGGDGGVSDAPDLPHDIDLSQSTFTVDRTSAVAGVDVVNATISLRDSHGGPVSGVDVVLTVTGTANTVTQPPHTNALGIATGTWSSTKAEPKMVTASILMRSITFEDRPVTFVAGPPAVLRFVQQPVDVDAGGPIGASVEVVDLFENRVVTAGPVVSLALGSNPPATMLRGTTSVYPPAGIVFFNQTHVDVTGVGYTLRATANGLTAAESTPFDVLAGAPASASSSLRVSPHSNDADGQSQTAIALEVVNQFGIPLSMVPVTFSTTGTGNTLVPAGGVTDASGRLTATLASTVAEVKTVSATVATITLTGTAYFYTPRCIPQLPLRPSVLLGSPVAFAVADVDGDGHVDVITAEPTASQLVIRRGRPDGRFYAGTAVTAPSDVTSITAKDVDGDGDVDLVLTRGASALQVLTGNGNGTFAQGSLINLAGPASSVAIGDFNGDGRRDLAATLVSLNLLSIHLALAGGGYAAAVTLPAGAYPMHVTTADMNVDGKADLLVVSYNEGSLSVYLGNGNGTFLARKTTFSVRTGDFVIGDFNRDTTPDVAVVNYQGEGVDILTGNRNGTFQYNFGLSPGVSGASVAMADFDGDTKLDLALVGASQVAIVRGAGDGTFAVSHRYAVVHDGAMVTQARPSGDLAAVDVDGDSVKDLVLVGELLTVVRGLPGGTFDAPTPYLPGAQLYRTSADLNGDGLQDLVCFGLSTGMSALLSVTDGSLFRAMSFNVPFPVLEARTGDVNGDGKRDVVTDSGSALTVALGRGDGTFVDGVDTSFPGYAGDFDLADTNGDGVLDVVLLEDGFSTRGAYLGRGNGDGTFGTLTHYETVSDPGQAVLADVDGDGLADLVVGTNTALEVRINQGLGAFGPAQTFVGGSRRIALADFDGDGVLDVATAMGTLEVMHGTGSGTFVHTAQLATSTGGFDQVTAADVDGDGTLDLVASSYLGMSVFQGYGDGYFHPPHVYAYYGAPFVFGHHNLDTRLDLAFEITNGLDGIGLALQGPCLPFVP